MKTLAVTAASQKLGYWLKRALAGEDIGIVIDGGVIGLRPIEVISGDYALQEYGVSEEQLDRAADYVEREVKKARRAGKSIRFVAIVMVRIDRLPRFRKRVRTLSESQAASIESALRQSREGFGQPHLHSGLGVRRLRRGLFECRAGLQLRILFWAERGVLTAFDVMNHEEVQAFLRQF